MATILNPADEARTNHRSKPADRNGKPAASAAQLAAVASFWGSRAPQKLREGGVPAEAAWMLYWKSGKRAKSIAKLCHGKSTPLTWTGNSAELSSPVRKILDLTDELAGGATVKQFAKGKRRKQLHADLQECLDHVKHAAACPAFATVALALAHALHALGGALDPKLGWELIDFLLHAASQAEHWQPGADQTPESLLTRQMLAGELPLTLSHLFAEMAPLATLAKPAEAFLNESLSENSMERGMVHGANIRILRPLLGSLTRCAAIGDASKQNCWSAESQCQYERLVRQSLRWTAADGTPLLAGADASTWPNGLLQMALRLGGDKRDAAAAKAMLGKQAIGKSLETAKRTPNPSSNCERSCLAVLRSDWSPAASIVAVDYSTPTMQLEVWAAGRRLLDGAWSVQPQVDGEPLTPAGAWEELCWFDDKDVAYLELAIDLAEGTRLERQIVLGRRDGLLLLVDHLRNSATAVLQHAWQLPLSQNVAFCGENETRDALLIDGKPLARLLPLALPEWRIDPRGGELLSNKGMLQLSQQATAKSLASPLFIDLRENRTAKPSTWRQLTVAEWLVLQPTDVAVAYRVQCGKQQWVYYRSQGPVGNRTFLGQNTSSECVIARFLSETGELEELIEIEA